MAVLLFPRRVGVVAGGGGIIRRIELGRMIVVASGSEQRFCDEMFRLAPGYGADRRGNRLKFLILVRLHVGSH